MADSVPVSGNVRAVDRALDILQCFARHDGGLSLSEIAREVDLHKSTVHRLLTSLLHKGFVRRIPQSDKYLLGWSVLELISSIYQSDELSAVVMPEMTELRDVTGETVSLYIRSGSERIRIQAVESNAPVRNVATVGKTYPLYVGASGKVLLAHAGDEVLDEMARDQGTPPDFLSPDFRQQLEEIRKDGYAISIQERESGTAAVAAPVFGRDGFVAALSISGPVGRFTRLKISEHVGTLMTVTSRVTRLLSH